MTIGTATADGNAAGADSRPKKFRITLPGTKQLPEHLRWLELLIRLRDLRYHRDNQEDENLGSASPPACRRRASALP